MKLSYLRRACGVPRWKDESNKSVYERCGMEPCANGEKCGVVEWVIYIEVICLYGEKEERRVCEERVCEGN